jgi:hypothetical protein
MSARAVPSSRRVPPFYAYGRVTACAWARLTGHEGTRGQIGARDFCSAGRAGCAPRQAVPGLWFTVWPVYRVALAEIRATADGRTVLSCTDAHEGRRAA